jgi:hypothetical protein
MSVKKLISRLSSTATIYEVARKAVVLLKVAPNNYFYFTAEKRLAHFRVSQFSREIKHEKSLLNTY